MPQRSSLTSASQPDGWRWLRPSGILPLQRAGVNGGILKTGPGTLALGADSSYSEPTVVSNGALLGNVALIQSGHPL